MVACDHHCTDTCMLCIRYGLHRFRTGRINHGNQTEENKILFCLCGQWFYIHFISEREYPQSLFGKALVLTQNRLFISCRHLSYLIFFQDPRTAFQKNIRCSFCQHRFFPFHQVLCTHQFPVGIKGKFLQTMHSAAQGFLRLRVRCRLL